MFQLYTVLPIHKIEFIDVAKCHTTLVCHFCYNVHVFYIIISLIKDLSMCLFVVAITIATALRSAVLVMVSKAESIVLYLSCW